jgi:pectate lyase
MAPEVYDLCDRLGVMVMDEAFDEWTVRKPQIKFGYSDVFNEWFERDVVDLVHLVESTGFNCTTDHLSLAIGAILHCIY